MIGEAGTKDRKQYSVTEEVYQEILKTKRLQIQFQDEANSVDILAMMYHPNDMLCALNITGPINYLKTKRIHLGAAFETKDEKIVERPFFVTPESYEKGECAELVDIFDEYQELFIDAFSKSGYSLQKDIILVDGDEVVNFLFVNMEDGNRYDYSTSITLSSRIMELEEANKEGE